MTEPTVEPTEPVAPKLNECTILDHNIVIQEPNPIQVTLIGRALRRADRIREGATGRDYTEEEGWAALDAVASTLDILEALIVNTSDRDWLERQMVAGNIPNLDTLTPMWEALNLKSEEKPNRAARRRK